MASPSAAALAAVRASVSGPSMGKLRASLLVGRSTVRISRQFLDWVVALPSDQKRSEMDFLLIQRLPVSAGSMIRFDQTSNKTSKGHVMGVGDKPYRMWILFDGINGYLLGQRCCAWEHEIVPEFLIPKALQLEGV